ncbi:hypothetical protein HKD37_01G000960 [Glycine soja]
MGRRQCNIRFMAANIPEGRGSFYIATTKDWLMTSIQSSKGNLNIDGSSSGNSSTTNFWGVICDHMGNWISGFSRKRGTTTNLKAKLYTMYYGLHKAWNEGFSFVFSSLEWIFSFRNTLCEANAHADWMAKYGAKHDNVCLQWFHPPQLLHLLLVYATRVVHLRLYFCSLLFFLAF